MKIVAIIQARMGSTRLPGKVLKKIVGKPALEILLTRLSRSLLVGEICVATSQNIENDQLYNAIEEMGYRVIRGSETDVLQRFWDAAVATSADIIVRITGDCPVIDPSLVDEAVQTFLNSDADYVSNVDPATFPDGLDVEVFSKELLERAHIQASSDFEREHVTPFMRTSEFERLNLQNVSDTSHLRLTLDEPEDIILLQTIFAHFTPSRRLCPGAGFERLLCFELIAQALKK